MMKGFNRVGRIANLTRQIAEQRKWIDHCGGTLAGYILRYGSKNDAQHLGDGGEAIYKADTDYLARLRDELSALTGKEWRR